MEESQSIKIKALQRTVEIIKSMPVWNFFEEFRADLKLLDHNLTSYLAKLDQEIDEFQKLPEINLTGKPKILQYNPAVNDQDLVSLSLRKTRDGYDIVRKEDRKQPDAIDRAKDDPTRLEGIEILEERVEREDEVFASLGSKKPWIRCKVRYVQCRQTDVGPLMLIRVATLQPQNGETIVFDATKYAIALTKNLGDKLKPTKRVIAGITESKLMPGIIGNEPVEANKFRYLVLMDGGSASYFHPKQIYPILGQSTLPWADSRHLSDFTSSNDLNIAYTRYFFSLYPRRHILDAPVGAQLELMRDGSFVSAKIVDIDCDIIRVLYRDGSEESVYRGSPRLMKKEEVVSKQLSNVRVVHDFFPKIIFLAHEYFTAGQRALNEDYYRYTRNTNGSVVVGREARAKKSTAKNGNSNSVRIKLVQPIPNEDRVSREILTKDEMRSSNHKCDPGCLEVPGLKTEAKVLDIDKEFMDVSDLKVPLLLGWKRQLRRTVKSGNKCQTVIVYQSPCGKYFQEAHVIRRHLFQVESKLDIDYFSFDRELDLNRPVRDLRAMYYIPNIAIDSDTNTPSERKCISLMNVVSEERLPHDFKYAGVSFPHSALRRKNFSFNTDFKSGCDCDNDCMTRASCACHRLNEQSAGKIAYQRGQVDTQCQYNHKRLPHQVSTGIFECNSLCKCSSKCSNRVVQNGIRARLQVHKTLNKGWGVITLDDIPPGAFICTYAAELLDDADQYGDSDMYYADLDYITVNEAQKLGDNDSDNSDEGLGILSDDEDNVTSKRKASSSDGSGSSRESDSSSISSLEQNDVMLVDDIPGSGNHSKSRYPKRKNQKPQQNPAKNNRNARNSRNNNFRRIHDLLGSHDFTLDARVQGNVGRFFNHSCDPNSHCQTVFIETHDLRFPVVAFFSNKLIKALDEITWNYNYKMGAIEGRRIDCHCGASNCKGRIL